MSEEFAVFLTRATPYSYPRFDSLGKENQFRYEGIVDDSRPNFSFERPTQSQLHAAHEEMSRQSRAMFAELFSPFPGRRFKTVSCWNLRLRVHVTKSLMLIPVDPPGLSPEADENLIDGKAFGVCSEKAIIATKKMGTRKCSIRESYSMTMEVLLKHPLHRLLKFYFEQSERLTYPLILLWSPEGNFGGTKCQLKHLLDNSTTGGEILETATWKYLNNVFNLISSKVQSDDTASLIWHFLGLHFVKLENWFAFIVILN